MLVHPLSGFAKYEGTKTASRKLLPIIGRSDRPIVSPIVCSSLQQLLNNQRLTGRSANQTTSRWADTLEEQSCCTSCAMVLPTAARRQLGGGGSSSLLQRLVAVFGYGGAAGVAVDSLLRLRSLPDEVDKVRAHLLRVMQREKKLSVPTSTSRWWMGARDHEAGRSVCEHPKRHAFRVVIMFDAQRAVAIRYVQYTCVRAAVT
jgi:hypothetical protein